MKRATILLYLYMLYMGLLQLTSVSWYETEVALSDGKVIIKTLIEFKKVLSTQILILV